MKRAAKIGRASEAQDRRADEAAGESEARFRGLLELTSDVYWEQDDQFRFTLITEHGPARGRTAGMLGRARWEASYFNMTAEGWAAHRAILDARRPFRDLELGRLDERGEKVWISVSGEPMFDARGAFKGYRGFGRDISERKRAEEFLRLAESNYRSIYENAVEGIYRVDGRGRVVEGNPALARMLGYATFEELKRAVSNVAHEVYVDSADRARYRALLEEKRAVSGFETRWRRRDGSEIWVSMSGRLLQDPVTAERYHLGMAADISARKRAEQELRDSEERFRSLSKLSSDFYWETDAQHRIVRNTREGETDVPRNERARVGEAPWEAPSTHPDAAGWARHRATLDAHLPFKDFEITRLDADGQEQHVSLSGEPMFGRDGAFLGYRGMGRNISDRKREERLLALEHSVSRLLVGSPSTAAGLAEVMRAVCEADAWDCGRYFALDRGAGRMRLGAQWTRPGAQFASFALAPQTVEYGPGEGLVGAAWTGGRPIWVPNVLEDPRVSNQALAASVGVHGAFLVPLRSDGDVIGIISLSSSRVRPPDARLLSAMEVVAGHVGQFLKRKSAEDALLRFRAALDGSADMVFLVDLRSLRLLDFNDTAGSYLGYRRDELLGANPTVYLAGVTEDELRGSFSELENRSGRADSLVRRFRRKGGKTFEAEVLRRVIDSPEGPILVVNARDLTERNMLEQRQAVYVRHQEEMARFGAIALEKREAEALVREAVQATREALRTDCIVYVERGAAEGEVMARAVAGLEAAEREPVASGGQPLSLALDQGELAFFDGRGPALPFPWAADFRSAAYAPVHGEGRPRGALCALSHDSHVMGIDECQFLVTVASVLSAGLRRIESEGRLAFLAQFDPLTGLPNRALLSDRLSQLIVQASRHGTQLGALFIDLDQFKVINDTLGHAAGDELLKEAARRLEKCVRPGDTVARISGDEFAVVLNDLARPEDGAIVAQKVIDALAAPLRVSGQEVFVSASIGIAVFPSDGDDAESLLGAADAAMYRAKQSGRNGFQFFTSEINQRTRARAQLATELRRALEREEFALAYQPKFDLRTGMPCGAEALLRWRRPDGATVPPVEFIPVLEETGLIVPVGEWVVRRACRDLNAWGASGSAALPVAVNLSARQFRQQDLDARIEAILGEAGVSPALLELEITESQLMHDPQHAIRTVRALHETGIRIAVDDFGTGYSSLSYLTRFAMSALKIDRSFVADVLRDQAAAAIVRAIVDMAHTLGFTVVAEGVETEGQVAFLRGLGCDQAQGYLFARPMPAEELMRLLAAGRLAVPH